MVNKVTLARPSRLVFEMWVYLNCSICDYVRGGIRTLLTIVILPAAGASGIQQQFFCVKVCVHVRLCVCVCACMNVHVY